MLQTAFPPIKTRKGSLVWAPLRIFMSIAFFNHSISETQTGYNLTKTLYNGPETITFTNPIGRIKSYTKGAPNIYKKNKHKKTLLNVNKNAMTVSPPALLRFYSCRSLLLTNSTYLNSVHTAASF